MGAVEGLQCYGTTGAAASTRTQTYFKREARREPTQFRAAKASIECKQSLLLHSSDCGYSTTHPFFFGDLVHLEWLRQGCPPVSGELDAQPMEHQHAKQVLCWNLR